MLKNIPKNLSPKLVKTLMEMGHGDEIVIADGNFPSATISTNVVRADGLKADELLNSILKLFPLDYEYSKEQVFLMKVVEGDNYRPEIWENYKTILKDSGEKHSIGYIERFEFYERARSSYAVIATGEEALYANIILKKGVVK
ncbi:RbsD/FucU family protein [Miniphocaeibacter halophilus]|uniref:Fucose isomerase n=1 Tax=Miniphocaeibacter halophilus TaxID=2931922 RepID=A0AC61MS93_9FIRM|nr:RbsD/FucU domain-containing protein [Miniphocaeibacter halophilus]QQK08406.1 fucose isomerase [Miniphocaeibacter halophilus]